jgi:hypothetical protein
MWTNVNVIKSHKIGLDESLAWSRRAADPPASSSSHPAGAVALHLHNSIAGYFNDCYYTCTYNIQGGSDISGTLSKLHCHTKKILF